VLEDSRVLVTGATGLIGKTLVNDLIKNNAKVIAVVRNIEKAKSLFGDNVQYIVGDVRNVDLHSVKVDYIIHAASQTSSRNFVKEPVETISVAIDGTRNLLDYAATQRNLKKFIYLSTMEVYGTPSTDEKISEDHGTDLDTTAVRSCYPESKRMCENLCTSYAGEYGVPVNILRLTQTFGPGVEYQDNRVFAEFARCAVEGKNIVLKTKGETKRSYLYTEDAINAIFTVAEHGILGEAYNVANEDTYCSIYEMAEMVADRIAGGKIKVRIEESTDNDRGFAPVLHMNLDTRKLKALGWQANIDLYGMYKALIDDWKIE
jgi:UDP-glucuronate decarboxylase